MDCDIKKIDKNMDFPKKVNGDIEYYPLSSENFYVIGLDDIENFTKFSYEETQEQISKLSNGMQWGNACTAGGQVHFQTNSDKIYIRALLTGKPCMDNLGALAQCGFDLYLYDNKTYRYEFYGITRLSVQEDSINTQIASFNNSESKSIIINLPLYCGIKNLSIGVRAGCYIKKSTTFDLQKKILFYGTSITQGASSSRSGLCLTNMVSRELGIPALNFGFSGSAMGEAEVLELISRRKADIYVIDYEANAYDLIYTTLAEGIRRIRKENKDSKIIICSMLPQLADKVDDKVRKSRDKRRKYIRQFVINCKEEGDDNIYFLDGLKIWGKNYLDCLMDGCHPNDIGFQIYKNKLIKIL